MNEQEQVNKLNQEPSCDQNCGEFPWYNPMPPYEGLPRP